MKRFAVRLAAFLVIFACLMLARAVGENDARLLLDWQWGAGVLLGFAIAEVIGGGLHALKHRAARADVTRG